MGYGPFHLGHMQGLVARFSLVKIIKQDDGFMGGRLGIGLGIGGSFDYKGKRPRKDQESDCGHGTTYGTFIEGGIDVGPYQWTPISAHGGYDSGIGNGYSIGPLNIDGGITFGNGAGISIGGAFGLEVVGY